MKLSAQQNPTYFSDEFAKTGHDPCKIKRKSMSSRGKSVEYFNGLKAEHQRKSTNLKGQNSNSTLSEAQVCGSRRLNLGNRITQLLWKSKPKMHHNIDQSFNMNSGIQKADMNSASKLEDIDIEFDGRNSSLSLSSLEKTAHKGTSDPKATAELGVYEDGLYRYNDCQRYAPNMYYNVGEPSENFSSSDSFPNYYNHTNFSTFARRHSIAIPTSTSVPSSEPVSQVTRTKESSYLIPCSRKRINCMELFPVKDGSCALDSTSTLTLCECDESLLTSDGKVESNSTNGKSNFGVVTEVTIKHQLNSMASGSERRKIGSENDCEPYCTYCSTSVAGSLPMFPAVPLSNNNAMMEVAILSCQDCFFSQRAESQLRSLLKSLENPAGQKPDILLQSYDIKDIDNHAVASEVHRAKVQIVIISNRFLDRLRHDTTIRNKLSPINRVLKSKRVIAVLVSLASEDIAECHKSVLARFHEWFTIQVKSTSKLEDDFGKALTEQITRIYNVELSNTANFSVFPTKVTKEQPKIVVLFKRPTQQGDNIRVELSRGQQTQILSGIRTTNPYSALIRMPDAFCSKTCLIDVSVFVNDQKIGSKLVKYEHQSKDMEDSIERMSRMLPGFIGILDEHMSSCFARSYHLCQDFWMDPSLELLHDVLTCREEEFPTVMHFCCFYGLKKTVQILIEEGDGLEQCDVRNEKNETPLDAAQLNGFGDSIGQVIKEATFTWKAFQFVKGIYERLSEEGEIRGSKGNAVADEESSVENLIVDEEAVPDAEVIYNTQTTYPDSEEPVESPANLEMSVTLMDDKQFLQPSITEPQNPNYLTMNLPQPPKAVASSQASMGKPFTLAPVDHYDIPRTSKDEYCIPPSGQARPVEDADLRFPHKNPVLKKKVGNITYEQQYVIPKQPATVANIKPQNWKPTSQGVASNSDHQLSSLENTSSELNQTPGSNENSNSIQSLSVKQCLLDETDENLIELMNNFKHNIYNLTQLELLFENWKSRSDVQNIMKEREKELKKIRQEYREMQTDVRKHVLDSSKNGRGKTNLTSIFMERIIKFLPGMKKSNASPPQVEDESTRKRNSDSVSSLSGGSIPDKDSDPDIEKPPNSSCSFWGNPHEKELIPGYVPPNPTNNALIVQPESFTNEDSPDCASPPPRPVKKISVTSPQLPIISQSPPLSPLIAKKPPPPVPTTTKPVRNKRSIDKSNGSTPPPPTPPRSGTGSQQTPFNFVNYKGRTKELNQMNGGQMKEEDGANGAIG